MARAVLVHGPHPLRGVSGCAAINWSLTHADADAINYG
jgi:hypothetical protein